MEASDLIGAAGVTLILIAFAANVAGRMERETPLYLALNLVGAALACLSSIMIGFVPFVVLEGIWAMVAAWGLLAWLRRQRGTTDWRRTRADRSGRQDPARRQRLAGQCSRAGECHRPCGPPCGGRVVERHRTAGDGDDRGCAPRPDPGVD